MTTMTAFAPAVNLDRFPLAAGFLAALDAGDDLTWYDDVAELVAEGRSLALLTLREAA